MCYRLLYWGPCVRLFDDDDDDDDDDDCNPVTYVVVCITTDNLSSNNICNIQGTIVPL
jgi:hypothetical protein